MNFSAPVTINISSDKGSNRKRSVRTKTKTNNKRQKTTNKKKETKTERLSRVKAESEMMIEKQQKAASIEKHKLKKRCKWAEHNIIQLQCVKCQEWKPRTTEYFCAQSKTNLESAKAGYETLRNTCKICNNRKHKLKCETSEDAFFARLAAAYPELPLTKLNQKRRETQPIRGHWSNLELACVANADNWQLNLCRKNNNKDHSIENIFFEAAELNPSQSGDTIPCLQTVYMAFVQDAFRGPNHSTIKQSVEAYAQNLAKSIKTTQEIFTQNSVNTPKQNGVQRSKKNLKAYWKQCRHLHLNMIINRLVKNNILADIKKGRLLNPITAETKQLMLNYRKKSKDLIKQALIKKPVCSVCRLAFTIKNGPRRFSMDRNDDNKSHFGPLGKEPNLKNINLRCRVFNTSKKMTRKKFLQFLLSQKLCELTTIQRELAQCSQD